MRYQPKEKPKYNIYCPLEPKCMNSVVEVVGFVGFFWGVGLFCDLNWFVFYKKLVTSAGFGRNMHHMFKTEQWRRRRRGDRRLLSNGIVLSRGITRSPNPIERSGRWVGSGKARRGSGRGPKNAVQLNTAVMVWSPQNFNRFWFFSLFFSLSQSTPSVRFYFSSITPSICSWVTGLSSSCVQFHLPLSSLVNLMSVKWGGSSTPNFYCKWCLSVHAMHKQNPSCRLSHCWCRSLGSGCSSGGGKPRVPGSGCNSSPPRQSQVVTFCLSSVHPSALQSQELCISNADTRSGARINSKFWVGV